MKLSKLTLVVVTLLTLPAGLFAEWGYGLGSENKSAFIPLAQQSGWDARGSVQPKVKAAAAPVAMARKPNDSDHDGVTDDKDECPGNTADTKVDATGCPPTVRAIKDDGVLKGVNFETDSDKIKTESHSMLNEAADILKARSKVRVQIQGHTDNMGDANANLDLSSRRAASVKNYLVGKGVSSSQLETKGFGASKPIADNNTVDGRAQNRRIAFKVLNR